MFFVELVVEIDYSQDWLELVAKSESIEEAKALAFACSDSADFIARSLEKHDNAVYLRISYYPDAAVRDDAKKYNVTWHTCTKRYAPRAVA